jgi:zinc protease
MNPLNRRGLLASALALPMGLAAQPGVDEPPVAQPPRPLVLPEMVQSQLANGLTVVVVPRPGWPVVSLALMVRAGPEADPPGQPGVAQMLALMGPKGAVRAGRPVPAAELLRQAEQLGGTLDTASTWGASTVHMTVSTPRAAAALALMADVLRRPLLAADELERARAQVLDTLKVSYANPAEVAAMALRRSHWGSGSFGTVTTPAAVQRLSRAALLAFARRWVRPDQVSLVLVGDVTLHQGQALAQSLLGDWRQPAPPAPALVFTAPQPMPAPLVLIDMPGAGQSAVAVAAPFVSSSADYRSERLVGQVANAVLGGGYSARLNQEVRIRRGLSYGATSSAEAQPSGGMGVAATQTQHANAAQVLQLLADQITGLANNPPTVTELAARQATLLGSFARRLETVQGVSALVLGQLAQGRPLDDLARYGESVLAVTPAQVQAFAAKHWAAGALRAVVVGDLAAAGEGLSSAARPQALRLGLGDLDLEQPGLRKLR